MVRKLFPFLALLLALSSGSHAAVVGYDGSRLCGRDGWSRLADDSWSKPYPSLREVLEKANDPAAQTLKAISEKPTSTDLSKLSINRLLELRHRRRNLVSPLHYRNREQEDFYEITDQAIAKEITSRPKQQFIEAIRKLGRDDDFIDRLVGLDSEALRDEDKKKHGSENHGKESTWMGAGHDYYGSSYDSFSVYDEALQIPKGGKMVDLGAGPFKAAVHAAINRPDMELVGYELFDTRVQAGQRVVERLGIKNRARIFQKDLSQPELNLEEADGYIMMNPFPAETSRNIFRNLEGIAKQTGKPFRVLIFNNASQTYDVAKRLPWLVEIKEKPTRRAHYGYFLFEVDPAKLK